VKIVAGRFDGLMGFGLVSVLSADQRLALLAFGLDEPGIEAAVLRWAPQVAIVSERVDLAVVERLRERCPQTGVLVLAYMPTGAFGSRVLAAGGNCATASATGLDVIGLVDRTARGERFFAGVSGELTTRRYPEEPRSLTRREHEVLVLVARGASHRDIARALAISVRTSEVHVSRVCMKLGVAHKRDLIGIPIPG
jgi:DNA-binding NarL/FixJ family response regulator